MILLYQRAALMVVCFFIFPYCAHGSGGRSADLIVAGKAGKTGSCIFWELLRGVQLLRILWTSICSSPERAGPSSVSTSCILARGQSANADRSRIDLVSSWWLCEIIMAMGLG